MKTITIEVDATQAKEWIDEILTSSVVFRYTHAGYWMRGVELNRKRGWLVFDDLSDHPRRDKEAVKAWRAGTYKLPPGYHRLNHAVALSAWKQGVCRWGVGWFHDRDATSWDVVLQITILGEVTYG